MIWSFGFLYIEVICIIHLGVNLYQIILEFGDLIKNAKIRLRNNIIKKKSSFL